MLARHTKSFMASVATIILMGCAVVFVALDMYWLAVILWIIGAIAYLYFLRKMWVVFVLAIAFTSCAVPIPTRVERTPPNLAEKQAMYHSVKKKPLKGKRVPTVVFWSVTVFVMTFVAVNNWLP